MKKKILLSDDSVFMRGVLTDILTNEGYHLIEEAGNGADAVRLYSEWHPDLVFMEAVLPEMNGIHALKAIMAADADAAVIMCSTVGLRDVVAEALNGGAKDYIFKPFSAERVLDAVRKHI
ncbi:MAG: response regulator [Lachnospiraceae bacterium]|nr:response regulator [Lachnospiraceae bacterium]